jgi:uncharacterized protein (DUF433 family)
VVQAVVQNSRPTNQAKQTNPRWRGTMAIYDRIEINPKVMMGKPVILGTRIPVELILRKLSEKATEADLLQAYPQLVAGDIQAAIRFAADTIAHEETVVISRKAS